ncbi:MAG: DUF642 domain-containing protein [Acetobacteraceae bacterium]|nr:DUF642 domain-containing protein [Acetobacteraceae bacterium]
MTRFQSIASILAAAAVLASGSARANILLNGDFDNGTVLAPTIPDWTTTNLQYGPAGLNVTLQDAAYVGSSGLSAWFNTGDSPTGGSLSQSFSTTVGAAYNLTFEYGFYGWSGIQRLNVLVSGDGAQDLNATLTATSQGLSGYGYTFTATGTTSMLSFTDVSPSTYGSDGVLAHVSVTKGAAVPEPASAALLLSGCVALLRRRRAA